MPEFALVAQDGCVPPDVLAFIAAAGAATGDARARPAARRHDHVARGGRDLRRFVLPSWFNGGGGPYDYLRHLDAPETMTPGGYFEYRDGSGNSQQVFAGARGRLAWLAKMTNPSSRVQARVRAAFNRAAAPGAPGT